MKRLLMIFLAVMLAASAASAQTQGYIGLFADDIHSVWCGTGFGTTPPLLKMYIFGLPRTGGTFGAEFMIDYPDDPSIIPATVTYHGDVNLTMGDLASGVSIAYNGCIEGWFMIADVDIYTTSPNQVIVQIVNHPTSGNIYFTDCEGARPVYPAVAFTNLYINYTDGVDPECSETATAERTWGAIKQMYME